ncbi:MAG: TetR/AcrR family transcriptional regulator [Pseudomonadales bacterium]
MSKRPVGRPRADGRPPLSKPAVFAAAATLIADHGYAGTSLRMIADALGASAPSLSQMFSSKQRLLVELVAHLADVSIRFHERLEGLSLLPAVRLHKMVREEVMAVSSANGSLMAIFYLPELRQPEFRDAQQARARMIGFYRDVITEGIDGGVFRNVEAYAAAEQVFQLTETSIVALDRGALGPAERLARETAEFVLRGLLTDHGALAGIRQASAAVDLAMATAVGPGGNRTASLI